MKGGTWTIVALGLWLIAAPFALDYPGISVAVGNASDRLGAYAVVGALALYLDFVNLFPSLLRFFGRRRR